MKIHEMARFALPAKAEIENPPRNEYLSLEIYKKSIHNDYNNVKLHINHFIPFHMPETNHRTGCDHIQH